MAQKSTRSNPGAQGEQAGRTVAPKPEAIICPTYHKEKYSTTIFYDLFGRGDTPIKLEPGQAFKYDFYIDALNRDVVVLSVLS